MPFVWGKLSKLSFYLKFKDKVSKCPFLKSRHGKFQVQLITTFDNVMRTNLRSRVESQPIVTTRRLYGLQYSLRISRLQRIQREKAFTKKRGYTKRLFVHKMLLFHYHPYQQGFQLRGVQLLSHAWQLRRTDLSDNGIYRICATTVPLVLSCGTVGMTT